MGFYFDVCEASCFLSIYRCGNDADSVLSSHSSPLCPPPPPQGSFPSTLESSRATRHHGLVERVQRDRRFVSPVRPYRKVSFSLREAPCLIPDCSCAPDFLSVCLLPVKTVKPLSCTLIAGNYFQQRMTKNLQQQLQDGVWNKSVCVCSW